MLECLYHPHLSGAQKPVARASAILLDVESTDGCVYCASTYTGLDTVLRAACKVSLGCTSIDHTPLNSAQLSAMLAMRPYALFPRDVILNEEARPRIATKFHLIVRHRKKPPYGRKREETTQAGTVVTPQEQKSMPWLFIESEEQMCDSKTDGRPYFVEMKLYGPTATDCGVPVRQGHSDSHILSLEALYNESAEMYGYAPYKASNWIRGALHRNRNSLAQPNADGSKGGNSIGGMSVEDVLRRELYQTSTATAAENASDVDFVPFVIVPRVEVEFIRIIKLN